METSSDAAPPPTAVLDSGGEIVGVNQAWRDFGDGNGLPDEYSCVGDNYVEISARASDSYGECVVAELRCLLANEQRAFTVEYPCHSATHDRWFRLYATAVRFDGEQYFLLVHHRLDRDARSSSKPSSDAVGALTGDGDQRERSRLVTYDLSRDETIPEGLVTAFDAIGIDVQREDSTLQDWIDPTVFDALQTSTTDLEITFQAWDYPVGLTRETVIIFTPQRDSE